MQSSADLQATLPLERWDSEALLSIGPAADKIYANFAAAMSESIAAFDTALFGMSKAEASATDPQVTKTLFTSLPKIPIRAPHEEV